MITRRCLISLRTVCVSATLCVVVLGASGTALSADALVVLRDGGATRTGELLREGADGVEIEVKSADGALTHFLRWDQIRTLTSDSSSAQREQRLARGAELWRARVRLARGDLPAARTLFTQASRAVDAAAVLERMIIEEGIAQTALVDEEAWAESLASNLTASVFRSRYQLPAEWIAQPHTVDARTGLLLGVAPVWLDGASAQQARESLIVAADRARVQSDLALAELLTLASRIAAADAGTPEKAPARVTTTAPASTQAPASTSEPERTAHTTLEPATLEARSAAKLAAKLLTGWADAVAADAPARKRGRDALQSIARVENGAVRMWAIYAEGRSLAMEEDPDKVRIGVGKMLLIPAAYSAEAPRLAAAALLQSSIALVRIHDDESAAVLRRLHTATDDTDRIDVQSNPGASP